MGTVWGDMRGEMSYTPTPITQPSTSKVTGWMREKASAAPPSSDNQLTQKNLENGCQNAVFVVMLIIQCCSINVITIAKDNIRKFSFQHYARLPHTHTLCRDRQSSNNVDVANGNLLDELSVLGEDLHA